jgi:hypothetical protein
MLELLLANDDELLNIELICELELELAVVE